MDRRNTTIDCYKGNDNMKLYTFDPAPNPRRLALFMQYKGIEIETQQIDLMAGEQFSDDYRKLNNHRLKPVGLNNGLKVRIRVD